MPDPSQVPVWIQTAETGVATAVGLWGAVVGQRQRGLQVFPRLLEEASALGPDEIARVVEANPSVAELVGAAWEQAARTANEDKRGLLAKVAARAVDEPDPAVVDPLHVLLATISALTTVDVELLARMAASRQGKGQVAAQVITGEMSEEDIGQAFTGPRDLLRPVLSRLQREGLVEQTGSMMLGYETTPAWIVTHYGRRLIDFL